MNSLAAPKTRRRFLTDCALAGAACATWQLPGRAEEPAAADDRALVAITLDLEMSRNFPTWEQTHWDYEKGNLDDDTKRYALEAARRVARRGGKMHFFVVGRVFEQADVDWLREIVELGHAVGNHTYDHVNVLATRPDEIQFRFARAPWLLRGREPAEVIAENIRLTTVAMQERLGIGPAGFRTPGGFHDGLESRPDVQQQLLQQGFRWVSSKYPAHPNTMPGERPGDEVFEGIVAAQAAAQPFVYPTGLVELPMSPISDIGAFRTGRWPLADFQQAIRLGVQWAIEERAVFDFLAHPSCLGVTDPGFETIDLICDLVDAAGERSAIVDLDTIAQRAQRLHQSGTG